MEPMYSFTENIGDGLKDFLEEAELQQYYELFRDILKVTKMSQLKYVASEDLVQIGMSKPEQRRYKKIYAKHFPNPYITKIKKILTSKKSDNYPPGQSAPPVEFPLFTENSFKGPTKHIIAVEDITINKELGMGQFGVVQQGTWNTGSQRLQVAIKCLGHERMMSNSTEFLKEAAVMHSIDHPNIVRLYGVVLHMESLMLVTELAPLRSLLECLREVSLRTSFPVPTLCEFAEQICDGMTYLENKRLIHRDLASRNILVFSKDRVKISDFGLSRALGVGKDYYQTNYNVNLKLPVAWCAPECILYLRFTSASDVWAFGVCLWEMFTYGFQPWAAFSGHQILEAIDAPNYQRLERPDCCPEAYYNMMLECWAHEPNDRRKFRDLSLKLREIRPEQVEATSDFKLPEDGRRVANFLEYKSGQIITVLGKDSMTQSDLWYGVLPGGACGIFDPKQTKPYTKPDKTVFSMSGSISPHPTRNSARSVRSTILRSDAKRHTYTGKRILQRSMISSPQGEVKHTGHVGLDGAYFGDISFLDLAVCPPRQVVTPYKPSEDLEQVPLINPNSPSHLTASGTPYPLLAANRMDPRTCDEVDMTCYNISAKKSNHKLEPTTSRGLLNKVKCAALGRSHKADGPGTAKVDEVHEYHEISDTDTETTAADNEKSENLVPPESPGIVKSTADFSQSLLDEMESMFRSFDGRRREHSSLDNVYYTSSEEDLSSSAKHFEIDNVLRSQTLKHEKKKNYLSGTGTMKPMSAHDEKTLDTAVAMANEITTRSMNDLGTDSKLPNSPSEKSKFHFKFPSLHSHNAPNELENNAAGKQERRNFSEEAHSVPDIQSTITEESKMAYTSLIEDPTPSSSLLTQMAKGASGMHDAHAQAMSEAYLMALNKHASLRASGMNNGHAMAKCEASLMALCKHASLRARTNETENLDANTAESKNELPLPPRANKPKLVDRPRHVRKHPLKLKEGCCTDHVSVEDLLEFADQKPCGRQRGVESDEVRIMSKVLKQQVPPEECLEALELSDWNVHHAIKVIRVRISVGQACLFHCHRELILAAGDVVKAAAAIVFAKTPQ